MPITIRSLQPEEWQLYREVRLAALLDSPEAFGSTYEGSRTYPEQRWIDLCHEPNWFAFDGPRPIGMVRAFQPDDKDLPELVSMWVAPEYRGGDTATRLMRTMLDWARDNGEAGVHLRVTTTNERARRRYERLGFVPNGITEHLPDGRVEVEMEHRFSRETQSPPTPETR
ncbi:GNAT family N-acetyltransferase [Enemella sp. A6]|uniref:GNAT family N-acetyltransferase n=1 Tax=Enemella sp. A6 TaxID=3440152 RepID=UPI003EB9CF22